APDEFAQQHGVRAGALVVGVVPGSPAAKAGLRATQFDRSGTVRQLGDIITGLDDHGIKSAKDLFTALSDHRAGDTVTVTYERDGDTLQVQIQLQAAS